MVLGLGILRASKMAVTTMSADQRIKRGEFRVRGDVVGSGDIELGPYHTEHAALMVDETTGSEL